MQGAGGHYRVFVEGQWVDPDDRVVREPNRAQVPLVWTYHDIDSLTGKTPINVRCFLPALAPSASAVHCAFDLLELGRWDSGRQPIDKRKALLAN
jgi:hypothetical protein